MASTAILAIRIISDASKAARDLQSVEKSTGKMTDKVHKAGDVAGKALAGGLLAAGAAAVKWGNQASDLAETQSKVNQIMGVEGARAAQKFADGAAKIGQSKQQALDAVATFATFGKAAGKTGDDLAKFSIQNTKLASDLASFHNVEPEEAIQALGAAFRGEAEPMRKFGVLLDDATMRQQAMKMGLIKTTKEALTPQQKVLAAQALIMKQTKDAQGDFSRTSDGLANKQRILKAEMANLTTEIGAKSLPMLLKLAQTGLGLVEWVSEHQTATAVLIGTLGGFLAIIKLVSVALKVHAAVTAFQAAQTKRAAAGQRVLNFTMLANPIFLVVAAIVALVAVFVIAYKKSETFRKVVHKSWAAIKRATAAVWNWLKSATKAAWDFIKRIFLNFTGPGIIIKHWDKIKSATRAAWEWVRRTTVQLWGRITGAISDKVSAAVRFVRELPSRIKSIFSGAGKWLWNAGRDIIAGLIDGITSKVGALRDKLGSITKYIPDIKGPPEKDRRLLTPAGVAIMDGLISGIESRERKLRTTLQAVTRDIERGVSPDPLARLTGVGAPVSGTATRHEQAGGDVYYIDARGAVGLTGDYLAREVEKAQRQRHRVRGRRVRSRP